MTVLASLSDWAGKQVMLGNDIFRLSLSFRYSDGFESPAKITWKPEVYRWKSEELFEPDRRIRRAPSDENY